MAEFATEAEYTTAVAAEYTNIRYLSEWTRTGDQSTGTRGVTANRISTGKDVTARETATFDTGVIVRLVTGLPLESKVDPDTEAVVLFRADLEAACKARQLAAGDDAIWLKIGEYGSGKQLSAVVYERAKTDPSTVIERVATYDRNGIVWNPPVV